jgi:hypothetical protein
VPAQADGERMFTFAVFSCNRLHYLRNCVQSIVDFVGLDDIDLLVVDNGSTEPGMTEYLSSLPASVCVHRFPDRTPGELYRAMNFAVDHARARGHAFVHFIQDDCQFLRRDSTLLARVRAGFDAFPEVAQVQTCLVWKNKLLKWTTQGRTSLVESAGDRWLYLHDKPPCDTGFTRVSLFDQTGPYPEHASLKGEQPGSVLGEEWMYEQCNRLGARRIVSLRPVMGMLFDAAYVRGYTRIGRYVPPSNRYYLKPLTESRVGAIEANSRRGECSCIEDFQQADGYEPRSLDIRSQEGREQLPQAA